MRALRKALTGYDVRRKVGWARLWILFSLMWMGYALASLDPPWIVNDITVLRTSAFGDDLAQDIADDITEAKSSDRCVVGTTSSYVLRYPPVPTWVTNFERNPGSFLEQLRDSDRHDLWKRHTKLYYGEAAVERDAAGRYPVARILVSCEPAGRRLAQWGKALAFVIAPPLVFPVALAIIWLIVTSVGSWLISGFRVSGKNIEADTAPLAPIPRRVTEPRQELATHYDGAVTEPENDTLKRLGKRLSWSVLIAMIFDRTARVALSYGDSSGTNLVLFASLGLLIYFLGRIALTRPRLSNLVVPWSLGVFWLCAALVMTVTIGRYA